MRQLRICSISPSLTLFAVAVARHNTQGHLRQVYAEIPYQSDVSPLSDWITGNEVDSKGEQVMPIGWLQLPKEIPYIQRAVFQIYDDGRVTKTLTEAGERYDIDLDSLWSQIDSVVTQYAVRPKSYIQPA